MYSSAHYLSLAVVLAVLWAGSGDSRELDGSEGRVMNSHATRVSLPPPVTSGPLSVEEALQRRRSIREYAEEEVTLRDAGQLLWAAQGITERASGLRTAPSAGALHPLELRLLAARVTGLPAGIYRYDPHAHALQTELSGDLREGVAEAALGQEAIRRAPAVLLLSGVVGRTEAKYGSRAERYVMMEAGHASENVYLQATALGLGTVAIGAFSTVGVHAVLQLPSEEQLLYIMPVGYPRRANNE
jgi:SagB-type dehydrogenase family enzyme